VGSSEHRAFYMQLSR